MWPADPRQMWSFPARFLIEFFANHGMLGFRDRPKWRTVAGGSHSYVEALVSPWRERLRLETPVDAITRHADHVTVTPRNQDPQDLPPGVHAFRPVDDPLADRAKEAPIPIRLVEPGFVSASALPEGSRTGTTTTPQL